MKIKNIWNHHLVTVWKTFWWGTENSRDPKNIPIICPKAMPASCPKKTLREFKVVKKSSCATFLFPLGLGWDKVEWKGGQLLHLDAAWMLVGKQQRVLQMKVFGIYHRWITVGDDPILELWFRRPLRSSRMTFYFRFFGYCGGTVCNRWQSRWWFQIVFIFTPTWGNDPFWLIFFKGVETTNQQCFFYIKSKWSKEIKLKVFSKFFSDF